MKIGILFSLTLLILGVSLLNANAEEQKRKYFRFSQICDRNMSNSGWLTQEEFWCIFGYSTSYPLDTLFLPFQATKYSPEYTEGSTKSTDETTDGTKKATSSDTKKDEVKQYKETFLAHVADDAADFNASPDRTPSTDLVKAWAILNPIFPGEDGHQLSTRLVNAHLKILNRLLADEAATEE